jgi:hypothetical protein
LCTENGGSELLHTQDYTYQKVMPISPIPLLVRKILHFLT